jgi:hypothetical protein
MRRLSRCYNRATGSCGSRCADYQVRSSSNCSASLIATSHFSRRLIHSSYVGVSGVGASARMPSLISASSSFAENNLEPQLGQNRRPPNSFALRFELRRRPHSKEGEGGTTLLSAVRTVTDADPGRAAANGDPDVSALAGPGQRRHFGAPAPSSITSVSGRSPPSACSLCQRPSGS